MVDPDASWAPGCSISLSCRRELGTALPGCTGWPRHHRLGYEGMCVLRGGAAGRQPHQEWKCHTGARAGCASSQHGAGGRDLDCAFVEVSRRERWDGQALLHWDNWQPARAPLGEGDPDARRLPGLHPVPTSHTGLAGLCCWPWQTEDASSAQLLSWLIPSSPSRAKC